MCMMTFFPLRLNKLRTQTGISARDMSLSLGQNPGYINNIENKKSITFHGNVLLYMRFFKNISTRFFLTKKSQILKNTILLSII